MNKFSYDIINRIRKIDNYFIQIIECEAFNAEELKDILLFRHQSSGFDLKIHGKNKKIKTHDYANLFNRIFHYSNGYVGQALLAWIANITDFKDNTIYIKTPKNPDISLLNHLDIENLMILVQFVLHKRLSISRIERITLIEMSQLNIKINYLRRSGVIIESHKDVFELNPYLSMHIVKVLLDRELL
jgi:hypothetical protein